ncbi:hypothetical protein GGS20DRAFT_170248 [Poronia punctata]|nr:hypothetical protein GGS20DRAFT_170248 [Poronia punctata]
MGMERHIHVDDATISYLPFFFFLIEFYTIKNVNLFTFSSHRQIIRKPSIFFPFPAVIFWHACSLSAVFVIIIPSNQRRHRLHTQRPCFFRP